MKETNDRFDMGKDYVYSWDQKLSSSDNNLSEKQQEQAEKDVISSDNGSNKKWNDVMSNSKTDDSPPWYMSDSKESQEDTLKAGTSSYRESDKSAQGDSDPFKKPTGSDKSSSPVYGDHTGSQGGTWSQGEQKVDHPMAWLTLILGILGFFTVITGVLAIIVGNYAVKDFNRNDVMYTDSSRNILKTGSVLGWLSILFYLVLPLVIFIILPVISFLADSLILTVELPF